MLRSGLHDAAVSKDGATKYSVSSHQGGSTRKQPSGPLESEAGNNLNQPGSTNAQQENQQSTKELFDIIRSKTSEEEKLKKIEELLAKEPKPDIDFKDKSGNTPLHVAMRKRKLGLEVIKLLIGSGARTDIKNGKH